MVKILFLIKISQIESFFEQSVRLKIPLQTAIQISSKGLIWLKFPSLLLSNFKKDTHLFIYPGKNYN